MNSQSVTDILLSLKTLVGEEAFQQSLSALSAKPEKSSAFGVPKQWANTVQQTADRLNALPASAPKKKGGRPTKAEAEARLAAMTPEERLQAEAKKAEAKAKRAAKKAEDSASVASATEVPSAASGIASGETSETGSKKKAGRPKMTEEQKAEAKAKREAKKAAKAAEPEPSALEGEWAEMAEALESN